MLLRGHRVGAVHHHVAYQAPLRFNAGIQRADDKLKAGKSTAAAQWTRECLNGCEYGSHLPACKSLLRTKLKAELGTCVRMRIVT